MRRLLRGLKFHFDNIYVSEPVVYAPILLWQVGDVGCDPGYVVKDHEQYCYEITCVVEGRGIISSDDRSFEITKGQTYLNRPVEVHRIQSDLKAPIRYFYLGFDFSPVAEDPLWSRVKKAFDEAKNPLQKDSFRVHSAFSELFDEMLTNDDVSQEMIRYSIFQILLRFYRELEDRGGETYVSGGEMEASRQLVYSILNYIDSNVFGIENLEDIGKMVGYSYSYVSRLFTKVMGRSIREYYAEKRFEKAASYLKGGMKSKDIAAQLGYKSLHSFSKAFSNHFGISPSEYRGKFLRGEEIPGGKKIAEEKHENH